MNVCVSVCTYEIAHTVAVVTGEPSVLQPHTRQRVAYGESGWEEIRTPETALTVHTLSSRRPQDAHTLKTCAQLHLTPHVLSARHADISIVYAERSYVGMGVCTRDRASFHVGRELADG